jgi:response regulator RpfG family c-di-GMP phosphodiesterase
MDVWDALCSDPLYRPAWSGEKVHLYVQGQARMQFDPKVIEAFLTLLDQEHQDE